MKKQICRCCQKALDKDLIGLNQKFLGKDNERFMCLNCLSDFLACSADDLLVKMEEFKEQGCVLFR